MLGTLKATRKFRILQQQVLRALHNGPRPGPFTFVIQCLYLVPILGHTYSEGFSHMLISCLRHFKALESVQKDFSDAKPLAAQLTIDILSCILMHEERILIKLLEAFDVKLKDIAYALHGSELNNGDLDQTRVFIENHILAFTGSQSYMTAVSLAEQFAVHLSGESFLVELIEGNQFKAAEKWASFMGKSTTCLLVQKYLEMKMLKNAYVMIKENDLVEEFPDVYYMYKERCDLLFPSSHALLESSAQTARCSNTLTIFGLDN